MAFRIVAIPFIFLLVSSVNLSARVADGRRLFQVLPSMGNPLCGRDCRAHEGTVLVPGMGRYVAGQQPHMPNLGGTYLGDSMGAAIRARFLPGGDDDLVSNPGYEIPNPFASSGSPIP